MGAAERQAVAGGWPGVIEAYGSFLPVTADTPRITLLEGNTPLVEAKNLGKRLGVELFLKYEGLNPTGSFKDRGMTVAMSKAMEEGSTAVMCASTGNTSASAAAFAAKAGLRAVVLIPEGKVAEGKLAQAIAHGALVVSLEGTFDTALAIVKQLTSKHPITLVNSLNPYRLEGQKTAAFEVCDRLGDAPDYLFIPVGNAGNITAYWKGFREYRQAGRTKVLPRMMGYQAAGAAPIVLGHPVETPHTVASALRIGNPARWKEATAAAKDSGGLIDSVTDAEIIEAHGELATQEGIFCELASAASLAGLKKRLAEGRVEAGKQAVCVLTGMGLKDYEISISFEEGIVRTDPTLEAIEKLLFD